MDILQARNLTKQFGNHLAVDNLSFSLREGQILGLLGPNGAGKTTTIQMLLGVLTPTKGEVFYFGKSLSKHREEILEQVNFSSTYTNLPWRLTVKENLTFVTYLYQIKNRRKRLEKLVQVFNLEELLNKKMADLSAGQQTRVNLAKAFINFPRVLLLDEPTASLDPDIADYIRKFLLNQREQFQVSIILTSHNMSEVEEVCDRVIFISHGKIVADNKPENLARTIEICHIQLLLRKGKEKIIEYCQNKNLSYKQDGRYIIIDVKEKLIANLLNDLASQKIKYDEISIEKPSLEDYFITASKQGSSS